MTNVFTIESRTFQDETCPYIRMKHTARKASWNIEGVEPGNQEGPG